MASTRGRQMSAHTGGRASNTDTRERRTSGSERTVLPESGDSAPKKAGSSHAAGEPVHSFLPSGDAGAASAHTKQVGEMAVPDDAHAARRACTGLSCGARRRRAREANKKTCASRVPDARRKRLTSIAFAWVTAVTSLNTTGAVTLFLTASLLRIVGCGHHHPARCPRGNACLQPPGAPLFLVFRPR